MSINPSFLPSSPAPAIPGTAPVYGTNLGAVMGNPTTVSPLGEAPSNDPMSAPLASTTPPTATAADFPTQASPVIGTAGRQDILNALAEKHGSGVNNQIAGILSSDSAVSGFGEKGKQTNAFDWICKVLEAKIPPELRGVISAPVKMDGGTLSFSTKSGVSIKMGFNEEGTLSCVCEGKTGDHQVKELTKLKEFLGNLKDEEGRPMEAFLGGNFIKPEHFKAEEGCCFSFDGGTNGKPPSFSVHLGPEQTTLKIKGMQSFTIDNTLLKLKTPTPLTGDYLETVRKNLADLLKSSDGAVATSVGTASPEKSVSLVFDPTPIVIPDEDPDDVSALPTLVWECGMGSGMVLPPGPQQVNPESKTETEKQGDEKTQEQEKPSIGTQTEPQKDKVGQSAEVGPSQHPEPVNEEKVDLGRAMEASGEQQSLLNAAKRVNEAIKAFTQSFSQPESKENNQEGKVEQAKTGVREGQLRPELRAESEKVDKLLDELKNS